MKYCKKCLQPDTRPNIVFGKDSVCPACEYYDALSAVDWEERLAILKEIASQERIPGQYHHCIIGVSGGKDSLRQALWVRDALKLNPLLVCLSYPPDQVSQRGVDNISNLINLGFDVVTFSPAPQTWKRLKKEGFDRFANSFRSTELALFSCVPQIALKYKINLILWGENPALQLGDMKTLGKTGYDGNSLRYMNTLSSGKEWMKDAGFHEKDLIAYTYPYESEFSLAKLKIIYLGWFIGDWSMIKNAMYSCVNGLKIREESVEVSGDLYGVTQLDEDLTPVNMMIRYYKYGFGRTSDYVNEEIRKKRMTRDEGVELVEAYDHICSNNFIEQYCDYLEITTEYFWEKMLSIVNRDLFAVGDNRKITPKFKVGIGLC